MFEMFSGQTNKNTHNKNPLEQASLGFGKKSQRIMLSQQDFRLCLLQFGEKIDADSKIMELVVEGVLKTF